MHRLWILCLAMACTKPPEEEPTPLPDTFDTGVVEQGWTPQGFSMFSTFGYDAEAGTLHTWSVDGTEADPFFALTIFNEDVDCTVYLQVDDASSVEVVPWNFEDATEEIDVTSMAHWGWVVPSNPTVFISNDEGCTTWDDVRYGTLDEVVTQHLWGAGVGTLRSDIAEVALELDAASPFGYARDTGAMFGGSWTSDTWSPNTWASHVATGGRTDDWALTLTEDGRFSDPILAADLETALPSGVYTVAGLLAWDFDTYLR